MWHPSLFLFVQRTKLCKLYNELSYQHKQPWKLCFWNLIRKAYLGWKLFETETQFTLYKVLRRAVSAIHAFFYKKNFHKKMGPKNKKIFRKCLKNLQSQMPQLQLSKTLIFRRTFYKIEEILAFISYLKFFPVSIIEKRYFIFSVKPN